jgi:hypothetical protein
VCGLEDVPGVPGHGRDRNCASIFAMAPVKLLHWLLFVFFKMSVKMVHVIIESYLAVLHLQINLVQVLNQTCLDINFNLFTTSS